MSSCLHSQSMSESKGCCVSNKWFGFHLYQDENSVTVSKLKCNPKLKELVSFRVLQIFVEEGIGVSSESSTTEIFVPSFKTRLVTNFQEVVQSQGSNFITCPNCKESSSHLERTLYYIFCRGPTFTPTFMTS
jgi:hypothetical protein